MVDFDAIPDDVPAEALSGAAKALRADEPSEAVSGLSKQDLLAILRYVFEVPDEYQGEQKRNVGTKELRHITKVVLDSDLREDLEEIAQEAAEAVAEAEGDD